MKTTPVWAFEQILEQFVSIDDYTSEIRGWCFHNFKVGATLYPTTDYDEQSDLNFGYEVIQIKAYGKIIDEISSGTGCILLIKGLKNQVLIKAKWFFIYE